MKLITKKYKVLFLCASLVAMLSFSGCNDFLDGDVEDGYSLESIQTMKQYVKLTGALYTGRIWIGYHGVFDWAVNESLAGNLLRINGDDGALFAGDVAATNGVLKSGFQSLFSGVISTANFLINKPKPTLTEEEAFQIEAEARLFRGLAYFLATEYWGEVPLIRNNEKIISDRLEVPKANRATLYKAIEEDFIFAAKYLPEDPNWEKGRVSSWSAKGMLAKLYLQMASCQANVSAYGCPYICPDYNAYYQKAIDCATDVIENGVKFGLQLESYAEIFKIDNPFGCSLSKEALLSIHLPDLGWAEGAHWQCYMAASYGPADAAQEEKEFWSPSACWGNWISVTHTLVESYEDYDLRKKEVVLYPGGDPYYNWQGQQSPFEYAKYGRGGSLVHNNVKKYVQGYSSSIMMMSNPKRLDFLRLADVYLIRAEAKMALAAPDVRARTSAGMDDIRTVLIAHAGSKAVADFNMLTDLPYYCSVPFNRELTCIYEGWSTIIDDYVPYPLTASLMVPARKISSGEYNDFIQERRKEMALEGHGWVDVKRLFYRNPDCAKAYFKEQDRGWCFTRRWGEDGLDLSTDEGYRRTALQYELEKKYPEFFDFRVNAYEPPMPLNADLKSGNFVKWFLPIPVSVSEQIPPGAGQDFTEELEAGTYKF